MDNIGFKLSLTTTLNQGHIYGHDNSESLVLPVTARDEEPQATTQESMFNYVRMSDGGITRIDNIRSESEILIALGSKLVPEDKFDFKRFNKHSNTREAIAECIPGMQDLKSIDVAKKEFHIRKRLMHRPQFTTPDKHAHFITHPSRPNSESTAHPFTLMTIRSEGQFNSIIYEENDSYRSVSNRQTVLMNKKDILSKGLSEGDHVTVRSDTGTMHKLEVRAFDLPRGNAMAYYPEANVLVGRSTDPRSKTPSFKAVKVSIHSSD
jgi:anaerobic selenocysteine-containing dehydrogenase